MINPVLDSIFAYASKNIAEQVRHDPNIINLSFGEPDFGPPDYALSELSDALQAATVVDQLKRYEMSRGSASLRQAIANYYFMQQKLEFDSATQILVTHGGSGGLTMALLAGTQPGDEVLVPDPTYTLYERLISILGRVPIKAARLINEGFKYDLDAIAKSITPKTRAFILNSPENPTGYVCSLDELENLVKICGNSGIWLIHDEVYDQFAFQKPHVSASRFSEYQDTVILVNSFSKKFGVPGLRVGWIVGNERLITAAAKCQDYSSMALNKIAERIAVILLASPGANLWFTNTRELLSQRLQKLHKALDMTSAFDFPCIPQGGMFLFPRVTKLGGLIDEGVRQDVAIGDFVSAWLMNDVKVATVSGSVYGRESKDFIRIVACVDDSKLEEAIRRISGAIQELRRK